MLPQTERLIWLEAHTPTPQIDPVRVIYLKNEESSVVAWIHSYSPVSCLTTDANTTAISVHFLRARLIFYKIKHLEIFNTNNAVKLVLNIDLATLLLSKSDAMTDGFYVQPKRQQDLLVPVQHYLTLLTVWLALNMTCADSGTAQFSRGQIWAAIKKKKGDEVHRGCSVY